MTEEKEESMAKRLINLARQGEVYRKAAIHVTSIMIAGLEEIMVYGDSDDRAAAESLLDTVYPINERLHRDRGLEDKAPQK